MHIPLVVLYMRSFHDYYCGERSFCEVTELVDIGTLKIRVSESLPLPA